MKPVPDLDIFRLYTGRMFRGSRSDIIKSALSHVETRELVWLYLGVNEIPWKRIRVPGRLAADYLRQGRKASRRAALWRTQTEMLLGQPFRTWYAKPAETRTVKVERSEGQRWRESIWLRKRQLKSWSERSKRRRPIRSRSSSWAA
jgi:hypothetical protein